jgi:hypothetical protein
MDPYAILGHLKSLGFFEVYHVLTFRGYREGEQGTQRVTVEVFDAGPGVDPGLRYHCQATTDDGRMTAGNPDSSVETALMFVHWGDLDKE